jgi:serine-type D-Ala-D-Ala carboxypeptidase/endopeptidase (penicillin-binding protein 4)
VRRLRRLAVPLVLLAATGPAPAAQAMDAEAVGKALAARAGALGPASGVRVVDLGSGRVLFSRREDVPRIPASNEKLFTTAAALLELGPATTFPTTVRLAPGVEVGPDGRVAGDLFLVGGGDPALGDAGLRALAAQVVAAGVERVTGGVRGDESLFDARRGGPRTGFAYDSDMGGWLTALAWGHARIGSPRIAAERLQRFLRAEGVTFGRAARTGTLPAGATAAQAAAPGDGAAPPQAGTTEEPLPAPGLLASTPSLPVGRLVALTNTNSDNLYAETLTKHLGLRRGAPGTTVAGLDVVRSALGRFGIRPRLADGSGLSRANRTTPRQVVRLLEQMAGQEVASSWLASMAVMGRTGTLFRRLRGTPAAGACSGKTGTIRRVSALSGYCRRPDGGLTAFSILANGVSTFRAKQVEDRLVRVIAAYRPAPGT